MNQDYRIIAKHYEKCFEKHGDVPLGVDWPDAAGMQIRYKVMLELIKPLSSNNIAPVISTPIVEVDEKNIFYGYYNDQWNKLDISLLDLGCGTGHFYEHLLQHAPYVKYSGIDINSKSISFCQDKYGKPSLFQQLDILESPEKLQSYDYIVMNGIFTEKRELTFGAMFDFLKKMLQITFLKAKKGIAFNLMSKQVDWERDDLFHLPLDMVADFMCKNLSRNFIIRNDYQLYEYTVYLYK